MSTEKELSGKVALITGSARNLGRGFAVGLASKGADIVVHHHGSNSDGEAGETARLVEEQGVRALVVSGDLVDTAVVRRLFDEAINAFGHVDIVINNAGVIIKKPFVEVTEQEFDFCFNVNCKAAFFIMQEAARRISDHGRIINIGTSLLGATIGFYGIYAGSKAPLEDFTRALAKEVGSRGITVNTVAPGPLNTPFFHSSEDPQTVAYSMRGSVAGRLGEIDDIVPVIEFLASANSQWITAQTIFVNGGYVSR